MKKILASLTAVMLMFAMSAGTAFAAESPNAESPNAESPNADSPNADSPNADSPNADSPNADSPNADSPNAESTDGSAATASGNGTSAASAVSPKTGVDLGTTAGLTATLLLGAAGATVLLRRELVK